MWIEKQAQVNDTVKVEFITCFGRNDFRKAMRIGVLIGVHDGRLILEFGDQRRLIPRETTCLVWTPPNSYKP